MQLIPTLIAVIGLAVAPAAFAQGCCSPAPTAPASGCGMAADSAACGHAAHGAAQATAGEASAPTLQVAAPVKVVLENYFQLQTALVRDSLQGVVSASSGIAKTIRADSTRLLSARIADQADAVAGAKDLEAARSAFKALSESLVNYAQEQKIAGLHVAYCPMAKASWLQVDKVVLNPYMGMAMPHCGQIKS